MYTYTYPRRISSWKGEYPSSSPPHAPRSCSTKLTQILQSSLVLRFVKDQFDDYRESTIGAAFLTQTISLDDTTTVKFEIWDTAGQERYKSLAPMYYRNANCAVVVYDITQAVRYYPIIWLSFGDAREGASQPKSIILPFHHSLSLDWSKKRKAADHHDERSPPSTKPSPG